MLLILTGCKNTDYDQAICDQCTALGLSIEHAQRLAAVANKTDTRSLLQVLGLDFATLVPLKPAVGCGWSRRQQA